MSSYEVSDRLQTIAALLGQAQTRVLQSACEGRMTQGVAEEIARMLTAACQTSLKLSGVVVGDLKIVRTVWIVRRYEVDQYGAEIRGTERQLAEYETVEEAQSSLGGFAREHEYVPGRWVAPDGNGHDWVDVARREKRV